MCSNYSKTFFLESPDSGDTFGYLYYGEKLQIDDFKRIFSKKHVKKRSWIVSRGYLWDVSIGKNDCGC